MKNYALAQLNFKFDDLEPYMDKETVEIHYTKHHQTYLNNFLAVIEKYEEINELDIEEILKNINKFNLAEEDKIKIINHGGGYYNHNLFWSNLAKEKEIDEKLKNEIIENFASVENFKKEFTEKSLSHFASGWTWLVRDENNKLQIYSLKNQDCPLALGHTPIFNLDLWEHAYYLKYQNRRAEFIENFWKILKII
jgi:Fe-Mn family superoxide dismutase